jgi:hypothetical protein
VGRWEWRDTCRAVYEITETRSAFVYCDTKIAQLGLGGFPLVA